MNIFMALTSGFILNFSSSPCVLFLKKNVNLFYCIELRNLLTAALVLENANAPNISNNTILNYYFYLASVQVRWKAQEESRKWNHTGVPTIDSAGRQIDLCWFFCYSGVNSQVRKDIYMFHYSTFQLSHKCWKRVSALREITFKQHRPFAMVNTENNWSTRKHCCILISSACNARKKSSNHLLITYIHFS